MKKHLPPPTGRAALRSIIIVLKEAQRVRGLSFLEKTLLSEAISGLKEKCYTRDEVKLLLQCQAVRSRNTISRMPTCIKELKNIKIINF
jgi:hypothetical protein